MFGMKMVLIASVLLIAIAGRANAIDCPKAKVLYLQVEVNSILVWLEGQNWHRVGSPADDSAKAMYSALLAAQMASRPVILRYPDGYDCAGYNLVIPAKMVRTCND